MAIWTLAESIRPGACVLTTRLLASACAVSVIISRLPVYHVSSAVLGAVLVMRCAGGGADAPRDGRTVNTVHAARPALPWNAV
eukprot:3748430-Prymnesium_polylepis.2